MMASDRKKNMRVCARTSCVLIADAAITKNVGIKFC